MKTTKISIKNLFGIKETELDGSSIEITGKKGAGKTSIIDSIRYALTNYSDRDYLIRNGESEGEILIETDSGLLINRKKRTNKSDYKVVKENGSNVNSPESFLEGLFTPLQLDPVAFTRMSRQEQNRIILDLIVFDWDLNWIREKFGEIPQGIDYQQNILQVLDAIQSEKGMYYQNRQLINSEKLHKNKSIDDIAKIIPAKYNAEHWETFDLDSKYEELQKRKKINNEIERAKLFKDSYNNKVRGYEAEKEIDIAEYEKQIAFEKENLVSSIERMKAEIKAAEDKVSTLALKLEDKKKLAKSEYETKVAKLDGDLKVADKYADKEVEDVVTLESEIGQAKEMIKHLNEYKRMIRTQEECAQLQLDSEELTRKIELARELPGEILKTATIPVDGLTVKDGIPLIHGLPVSNLSDGEKIDLCVDVTISKTNSWQIILLDRMESLDDTSRAQLYAKCKEKGLQFIATRTTNDNELEVTIL